MRHDKIAEISNSTRWRQRIYRGSRCSANFAETSSNSSNEATEGFWIQIPKRKVSLKYTAKITAVGGENRR